MARKQPDQTEQPTPKRLRDARKRGQVPRSQDLSRTLLLALWAIALSPVVTLFIEMVQSFSVWCLDFSDGLSDKVLTDRLLTAAGLMGQLMMILALLSVVGGLLCVGVQTGALLAPDKLTPKFETLNPVEGMKRLLTVEKLVEGVKSTLLAAVVVWLLVLVIYSSMRDMLALFTAPPLQTFEWLAGQMLSFMQMVVGSFLVAGMLDLFYQHHLHTRQLMMSLEEIKREQKEQNGDPLLRSKRKQLHREWSSQNMVAGVKKANVLVTNPIHFAVALRFDPEENPLPVVSAKGQGLMVPRMRAIAGETGIPVIENIPLARGLYADVAEGEYITEPYFQLVAEVLHWAEEVRTSSG